VAQVQATIENVPQNPGTAFTVSGNTITFDGAPPSGTNNIYVYYTSPITQVIQPGQGTVGTAQIQSGVTVSFADGSAAAPSITNLDDSNTGMFFPAADTIAFAEGGAEIARFNSSGNLGIGTNNPAYQLDLNGGTTVNNRVQLRRGSDDANQSIRIGWDRIESVRADVALSSPQTSLSFIQTGSNGSRTTMLINSNGSVTQPLQPAFSVYKTTNTANNTTYVYDAVSVNIGSYYNTANGRFTAPVDGRYFISTYCAPESVDTWGGCAIYVNGSLVKNMYVRRYLSNGAEWCTNTTILNLSVNDYVTIYNPENTVMGGIANNGFCGYLIG
jgi:hypothetical protein